MQKCRKVQYKKTQNKSVSYSTTFQDDVILGINQIMNVNIISSSNENRVIQGNVHVKRVGLYDIFRTTTITENDVLLNLTN